jgi:hypothetical protein
MMLVVTTTMARVRVVTKMRIKFLLMGFDNSSGNVDLVTVFI